MCVGVAEVVMLVVWTLVGTTERLGVGLRAGSIAAKAPDFK